MTDIDKYISENNMINALEKCVEEKYWNTGILLGKLLVIDNFDMSIIKQLNALETRGNLVQPTSDGIIYPKDVMDDIKNEVIRVMLLCNWTTSEELCKLWNKMSQGKYRWNNIRIVWEDIKVDYYVIINKPPENIFTDPKKTILFRMEPYMERHPEIWGEWSNPDKKKFYHTCFHDDDYNNLEWHLSKTYTELKDEEIKKDDKLDNVISTVLSAKYSDPGHIKRIDFVRHLEEEKILVHVYGSNKFEYDNYKGSLPYHNKNNALLPYKYIFNAENNSIPNYLTEKLIDGILAECLTFYWGDFGVKEWIDDRAYVYLDLTNFDKCCDTVKKALEEDWWSKRIEYIRAEKKRILNDLQFFPRLEKIIGNNKK